MIAAARAFLYGLAFCAGCTAALLIGAALALRGAWRFARNADRAWAGKPPPRKAFDGSGIPVADWDRFCAEIAGIQRDMVAAAWRWDRP
jgi:hypothetical protein